MPQDASADTAPGPPSAAPGPPLSATSAAASGAAVHDEPAPLLVVGDPFPDDGLVRVPLHSFGAG
eukprot:5505596-Alexandrium_andersonii.AAC.1